MACTNLEIRSYLEVTGRHAYESRFSSSGRIGLAWRCRQSLSNPLAKSILNFFYFFTYFVSFKAYAVSQL